MRLLPPPHHPSNNKNNDTAINNSRFSRSIKDTGNSNDDINDVNNADDYKSWTNGNWCWLLPTGSKKRHKHPVRAKHHRNCRTSSQTPLRVNDPDPDENNEFDKDYSENDDGNEEPKKSRTGRNTTAKWQHKRWTVMFRRLVLYKNQHKSTAVPTDYALDPELGHWVKNQRGFYRNEKISDYRIDRLESIGFVWNTLYNQWDEMFNKLMTYKNQHGSTLVPEGYEADTQLGPWVCTQRWNYNQSKKILSVDRIKRLESIGFVWDVHEMKWTKMYDRLRAYKNKHKSTQVPYTYTADNQLTCLGYWVYKQRSYYRDGKLLKKRVECLNSIDFEWEAKK
jgi:hypothetical protein